MCPDMTHSQMYRVAPTDPWDALQSVGALWIPYVPYIVAKTRNDRPIGCLTEGATTDP